MDNRIRLMTTANRYLETANRTAWVWPIAVLVATGWLALRLLMFPAPVPQPGMRSPASVDWPVAIALNDADWSVFQNRTGSVPGSGSLAERFRFAGMCSSFAVGAAVQMRQAVLDDLKARDQIIVVERQDIGDGIQVVRIFGDRIVLRDDSGEQVLWLSFNRLAADGAGGGATASAAGAADGSDVALRDEEAPLRYNRFGRQIGERDWVFERKALEEYYSELRDEPERLVQVFDSLKPLYDDEEKITGYELGIEGEAEFFDAVGMQEGDVVLKVNHLRMTNRRRAEFFIGQFVANKANAFVLQVERDGVPTKLVYRIR